MRNCTKSSSLAVCAAGVFAGALLVGTAPPAQAYWAHHMGTGLSNVMQGDNGGNAGAALMGGTGGQPHANVADTQGGAFGGGMADFGHEWKKHHKHHHHWGDEGGDDHRGSNGRHDHHDGAFGQGMAKVGDCCGGHDHDAGQNQGQVGAQAGNNGQKGGKTGAFGNGVAQVGKTWDNGDKGQGTQTAGAKTGKNGTSGATLASGNKAVSQMGSLKNGKHDMLAWGKDARPGKLGSNVGRKDDRFAWKDDRHDADRRDKHDHKDGRGLAAALADKKHDADRRDKHDHRDDRGLAGAHAGRHEDNHVAFKDAGHARVAGAHAGFKPNGTNAGHKGGNPNGGRTGALAGNHGGGRKR